MISVMYDNQVFLRQGRGGISRYFVELIKHWHSAPQLGVVPILDHSWTMNEMAATAGFGRLVPQIGGRRIAARLNPLLASGLNSLTNRLPVEGNPDIVHYTQYSKKAFKSNGAYLNACTVYDMIPERFPDLFPAGNPHKDKQFFVESCDLIICISESTRQDLEHFYGKVEGQVVVVPLGVGAPFSESESPPVTRSVEPWLPREAFALFVGNRPHYKAFSLALEAMERANDRPMTLLAVGGGRLTAEDKEQIATKAPSIHVQHEYLSDAQLAVAYSHASMFLFPSHYEGFGLPTLEAMASGCPVLVPYTSSHIEVAGNAGTFFEDGNSDDLASGIERIYTDSKLREAMVEQGKRRARDFTWGQCAEKTALAYRGAM